MNEQVKKPKKVMVYVGNLNYSIPEKSLLAMFSEFGTVNSVNMMRDTKTDQKTGIAFVEMCDETEAANAIAHFNARDVGGRILKVSIANDRYAGKSRRDQRRMQRSPERKKRQF